MRTGGDVAHSAVVWVPRMRAAWGVALLSVPRPLLRRMDQPVQRTSVVVLRVLGARHVAQSVLETCGPRPVVGYLGAGADGLHALTGVALAVMAPRWRRGALVDCAVAASFAVLTAATTRCADDRSARSSA